MNTVAQALEAPAAKRLLIELQSNFLRLRVCEVRLKRVRMVAILPHLHRVRKAHLERVRMVAILLYFSSSEYIIRSIKVLSYTHPLLHPVHKAVHIS